MISTRQRRTIASGAAACAVAAGLVALAQPSAQAAACSATRSSTVSIHGIANEYEVLTHYTRGGQVVADPRQHLRSNVNTGSVSVTILACMNPRTKTWAPLTYAVSTDLRDLDLFIKHKTVTPLPADGDRGFGVMVGRVTRNRVEIQPLVCARKPTKASVLGVVKFVTGLPLPVSLPKEVGLYVVNNALPEQNATYACGLLGKVTAIPLSLSSEGKARLSMPTTGHYLFFRRATWTEAGCFDYYCGISHDQVLEVRAGT
jgi:hypothetical protein